MQIMVGCGTISVFHVGGGVEGASSEKGGLRRWEYFVGDQPHAVGFDSAGRRQLMEQIQQASNFAVPSRAAVSAEVAKVLQITDKLTACEDETYLLDSIDKVF